MVRSSKIFNRSFDSDKSDYRYLAHKIADEIIFAITKKGSHRKVSQILVS